MQCPGLEINPRHIRPNRQGRHGICERRDIRSDQHIHGPIRRGESAARAQLRGRGRQSPRRGQRGEAGVAQHEKAWRGREYSHHH